MLAVRVVALGLAAPLVLGACTSDDESARGKAAAEIAAAALPFKAAHLIVDTNATDGDARLALFLNHEPWKSVALYGPNGGKILDIHTDGALSGYGLTELFSKSSESPFEALPLEQFKKAFFPGSYRLTGTTIEGQQLQSTLTLTHDVPRGPKVTVPEDGATVPATSLVVTWERVTEPAGITILGYQVAITNDEKSRALHVDLPANATSFVVPAEFLESGEEYKVKVIAIEKGRNQTVTELTVEVA